MPPSLPTSALGAQNGWAKKLESGRLKAVRGMVASPTLQMREPTGGAEDEDGAQSGEAGGGSPKLAAAAGATASAARLAGRAASVAGGAQGKAAGKALQLGATALDYAKDVLKEQSVEQLARETLYRYKTFVLWPAVGLNIVVEPLSAFSYTFVAMQLYWVASMFFPKHVKPMPIWEHVIMIMLTLMQLTFILIVLMGLALGACAAAPVYCAFEIFQNSGVIPGTGT